MQDRPDAAQLLTAVVAYLRQRCRPGAGRERVNRALAYQAKVAANMLDIAAPRDAPRRAAADAEPKLDQSARAAAARLPPQDRPDHAQPA